MKEKDVDLIQRFIDGEEDLFSRIYSDYYNFVYYTAYQYFKHHGETEDATQEVFIHIYNSIHSLKDPSSFAAWVMRITHYHCGQIVRKKSYQMMVDLGSEFEIEEVFGESYNSQGDELLQKEVYSNVLGSIMDLPNKKRDVAVLRYFYDMEISEISYALSIPTGTVKSRLNKIRKDLQKNLTQKAFRLNVYIVLQLHLLC